MKTIGTESSGGVYMKGIVGGVSTEVQKLGKW